MERHPSPSCIPKRMPNRQHPQPPNQLVLPRPANPEFEGRLSWIPIARKKKMMTKITRKRPPNPRGMEKRS